MILKKSPTAYPSYQSSYKLQVTSSMALNETEQIKKLLEDKKNILIAFRKNGQGDAIGASTALALFLEKMGKQVDIVSDGFDLPHNFKFLKKAEDIKSNFPHLKKFIIAVDVSKTGVQELSYDIKEDKLRLFITPRQGMLNRENIHTIQSDFRYEVIFVIDTPDLHALGSLYENNSELFYNRPIINIDYHTANEHFGQINLIEITATSTGEILFNLIEQLDSALIDHDIANSLLTAIIANTHSFKIANVKPQTLALAGQLMKLGADRDHIIQNLYRTRRLSTLKLWGEALSHLQHEKSIGLVWTTITREDFIRSGADSSELYDIVEELISNSPEAKIILLFHEQNEKDSEAKIHVILESDKEYNAEDLLKPFNPVVINRQQASMVIAGKKLREVEEEIISHIKKTLA